MAIIALSRQVASLGDEIAAATAEKLGYSFIGKKELESKIVSLGFPAEKLPKYDERKPGFFASLVKDRDEYLDFLQTAVLETAQIGNCILIGRGSALILASLENAVTARLIAPDSLRLQRLQNEFNWDVKQAQQRITESDTNRVGFYKSFFNTTCDDQLHFHFVMNTGIINVETGASMLSDYVKNTITPEKDDMGKKSLKRMLDAQHLVNKLVFEYKIPIEFLRAEVTSTTVTLFGVTHTLSIVDRALRIAATDFPGHEIKSAISVTQSYKA